MAKYKLLLYKNTVDPILVSKSKHLPYYSKLSEKI